MATEEQAQVVQVQFTVDRRALADELARELVEARLAACVQVEGPVRSTYRWEGAVEVAEEWRAVAKTTTARWPALADHVRGRHPYGLPELLVHAVQGSDDYLAWVAAEVTVRP